MYTYLLLNLDIKRVNQGWEFDIICIPMAKGHMYLIAIIDFYSRYIVGWNISNTLGAENMLDVFKQAVAEHGKPENTQ